MLGERECEFVLVRMLPLTGHSGHSFFAGDQVLDAMISKPHDSITRCVIFPCIGEAGLVKSGYVPCSR